MFTNKMDFSSCVIWIDFYRSGHICMKSLAPSLNLITFTLLQSYHSVGAFGMVHKGKLVMPDSSVKAVAIKTIKCKCSNLLCYAIVLCYIS